MVSSKLRQLRRELDALAYGRRAAPSLASLVGMAAVFLAATPIAHATAPVAASISTTPALYPGFSPDVHNYVVRCTGDPVTVNVNFADPDVAVSVDGGRAVKGRVSTLVAVGSGQGFAITTRHGTGGHDIATYYVRCLPQDFPAFTASRSGTPQAQYYLVTPSLSLGTATSPYLAIFDTNGAPLWWMSTADAGAGNGPIDATLLPDGNIAFDHFKLFGSGGFQEYGLDGSLRRTDDALGLDGSVQPADFHELQVATNGDYLIGWTKVVQGDLSACGGPSSGQILDPVVDEVSPAGTLVWSWDAMDHIPLAENDALWRDTCTTPDANGHYDVYHFNAISLDENDPDGRDMIVSMRHEDAVYKVSMTTGNIIWKLGGTTRPDGTSLTVVNDPDFTATPGSGFGGQHDPRMLPDGTLTIHDNGSRRLRPPRALRYRVDQAARTATLLEEVTDTRVSRSACCGSARRLPQGDWVASWGASPYVTELTPSGAPVFTLQWGAGLFSYRAQPILPGALTDAMLRNGMDAQHPR